MQQVSSFAVCVGTASTHARYRQVTEMVNEREMAVNHTTIYRWVQEYGPEIDKRCRPYLRPTNDLWQVDETYIKVKGEWKYLSLFNHSHESKF